MKKIIINNSKPLTDEELTDLARVQGIETIITITQDGYTYEITGF